MEVNPAAVDIHVILTIADSSASYRRRHTCHPDNSQALGSCLRLHTFRPEIKRPRISAGPNNELTFFLTFKGNRYIRKVRQILRNLLLQK